MTQYDKVLRHLKTFGSITPLEAFQEYAIMRLSAVVFDLRKDGYKIESEHQTGKNRFGENSNWVKYIWGEDYEIVR